MNALSNDPCVHAGVPRSQRLARLGAWVVSLSLWIPLAGHADPEDALWSALTSGKPDLSVRWRYEHVDDDLRPGGVKLDQANASTVRATLGYGTGAFHGFSAYL